MPVIPAISQGIMTGLKFTPAAPPQLVGAIKSGAQGGMASASLLPMAPSPIPVIPVGIAVSSVLTMIEAIMFKTFEETSKLTERLMKEYYKQLNNARSDRESAQAELYESEKTRQEEIKEEIVALEEEIATLQAEIEELTITQEEERAAYEATIFEYKENAKKAEEIGDIEERDFWIAKVEEHDPWLAEIIQIVILITNKKIEVMTKQREIESKQELANLSIKNEWTWLETHATDFEVAVPFYPDLPMPPNLPPTAAIPQEGRLPKFARQIFAKWIAAPMVPPIGLVVAAIQMVLQSYSPSLPAPASAQIESTGDSMILTCGGAF